MEAAAKIAGLMVLLLAAGGCVSSSPETVLSTAEPLGRPQSTDQFPKIGHVPVGQTSQMTPTEKAIAKRELEAAAAQGRAQAAQQTGSQYKAEIDDLRKKAADGRKQLLEEIETENRSDQADE